MTLDDFDFVLDDAGDIGFRALDGTHRSDTWLSNRRELVEDTEPWDPDTDDDGLTDGQEVKGVTRQEIVAVDQFMIPVYERDPSVSFETNPRDVDTDGDGYWDGWVGVYNASDSRNVVLYIEHLHDDDDGDGRSRDEGVQGPETVPAQIGTHPVSAAPNETGADVDSDNVSEHSNLHVGELVWGTDPMNRGDEPSPELTLEVDFYAGAHHRAVNRSSWEWGIENNTALYDIRVNVSRDETLQRSDLRICRDVNVIEFDCIDTADGFSIDEIRQVRSRHGNEPSDEYLLVAHFAGGSINEGREQTGVNLAPAVPAHAVFTEAHVDITRRVSSGAVGNSPYESALGLVVAKTELHELGHSFGVGEADDFSIIRRPFLLGEVYSGEDADPTPEEVNGENEWSLMVSGWDDELLLVPMNGRYFSFSIEEAVIVEEAR